MWLGFIFVFRTRNILIFRFPVGISGNPFLVLPYTPQQMHMPNFNFLCSVLLAVRCLSVSHSVTEEFDKSKRSYFLSSLYSKF